jgi:hypothetical protein
MGLSHQSCVEPFSSKPLVFRISLWSKRRVLEIHRSIQKKRANERWVQGCDWLLMLVSFMIAPLKESSTTDQFLRLRGKSRNWSGDSIFTLESHAFSNLCLSRAIPALSGRPLGRNCRWTLLTAETRTRSVLGWFPRTSSYQTGQTWGGHHMSCLAVNFSTQQINS